MQVRKLREGGGRTGKDKKIRKDRSDYVRERAEKIQAGKEIQGRPREARIRFREGEEKIYGR